MSFLSPSFSTEPAAGLAELLFLHTCADAVGRRRAEPIFCITPVQN